jgi:imidazoleglycerol-phosphate dehydratase
MSDRTAELTRKTTETEVSAAINLDGAGKYSIDTGVGFLDHMLELFSKHSGINIDIKAKGDTHVDYHHLTEDVGIVIGTLLNKALGDKKGIRRYGFFLLPMDEVLMESAVDLSGRSFLNYDLSFASKKIGDFDTELIEEFFRSFTFNGLFNLHIVLRYGTNSHHVAEAAFKSVARSLKVAIETVGESVPSTKGVL